VKYLEGQTWVSSLVPNKPTIWYIVVRGLTVIRLFFPQHLAWRRMKVGNGKTTSFWHDAWCSSQSLRDSFPNIFNICNEQTMTVAEAAACGWNFSFRRYCLLT
jgi:hypothetical protein